MKTTLINGTCAILGGIHFVALATTEITAKAEAKLQAKNGNDPFATIENRMRTSYARIDRMNELISFKKRQSNAVMAEAVLVSE